ncbi:MAG: Ig-like domain-containing protein [Gemmatimonadota bacterium]
MSRKLSAFAFACALTAACFDSPTGAPPPTGTLLTSSPNPSVFGQVVIFTATVSGGSGGALSGAMLFSDAGLDTNCGGPLGNANTSLCFAVTLAPGIHPFQANYLGDANSLSSTSNVLNQAVNMAATTTSIVLTTPQSQAGTPLTLSATVTVNPPGAGALSGFVTFKSDTSIVATCSRAIVNSQSGCSATITPAPGMQTFTAQYSGDVDLEASSSIGLPVTVQ